jgi:hypothetical protein
MINYADSKLGDCRSKGEGEEKDAEVMKAG